MGVSLVAWLACESCPCPCSTSVTYSGNIHTLAHTGSHNRRHGQSWLSQRRTGSVLFIPTLGSHCCLPCHLNQYSCACAVTPNQERCACPVTSTQEAVAALSPPTKSVVPALSPPPIISCACAVTSTHTAAGARICPLHTGCGGGWSGARGQTTPTALGCRTCSPAAAATPPDFISYSNRTQIQPVRCTCLILTPTSNMCLPQAINR